MTHGLDSARLRKAFEDRFNRPAEGVASAPGRVNLIGDHVDYNEGLVLPMAINRRVAVAFAQGSDPTVRVWSLDYRDKTSFSLDDPIVHDPVRPWVNYVRGLVKILLDHGHRGSGLNAVISGSVPEGAGLSSSAALEVATMGALAAAWDLRIDRVHIASLCQQVERDFVGVNCGPMDQLTATMGEEGNALLIDCRTTSCAAVPLPFERLGLEVVVIHSGIPRQLRSSDYNQRREECRMALEVLRQYCTEREIRSLRDVSEAHLECTRSALDARLFRRVRHVITEMNRVQHARRALDAGDAFEFGRLMHASHRSLQDDFEVSCRELDTLVDLARASGSIGSRLTGAGFGGCTVNLVPSDGLEQFVDEIVNRYRVTTGLEAAPFVCRASNGLQVEMS